jgi:hypothetical protein
MLSRFAIARNGGTKPDKGRAPLHFETFPSHYLPGARAGRGRTKDAPAGALPTLEML